MAQMTMSEKDTFRKTFEQEAQTTLKIFRAYPAAQGDLKPHQRSMSAREIGWLLVGSQRAIESIIKGGLRPEDMPDTPPPSWPEIISTFETAHREALGKIDRLTENDFNGTVRMPVGPQKTGDVRRGSALWMMLYDTIHHRGQLSVYLRMAGGKVPSIYGPSGDEPWW